jgi:hypothetical protein
VADSSEYPYCKIFIKGAEPEQMLDELAALLDGEFDQMGCLALAGLAVEVRRNKDAAGAAERRWRSDHRADFTDSGDDFVLWPVLVEVYAEDDEGGRAIVETTARIVRALWEAGNSAVAACDFEDELPWSGGIERLSRGDG